VIANAHRSAAVSEISRAGIVAEGEDRRLRTNAHIIANSNGKTAAIEKTALVDHAALAQLHAGTMQKTTM
jgi:hypothetical protein